MVPISRAIIFSTFADLDLRCVGHWMWKKLCHEMLGTVIINEEICVAIDIFSN